MVAGWREIARICGYFAPETKQINISVNGAIRVAEIEQMTDDELSKLIMDGESTRLDDDDDLPEEDLALLEAPNEFVDAPDTPYPDEKAA